MFNQIMTSKLYAFLKLGKQNKEPVKFKDWQIISKPRKNNSGHGGVAALIKPSQNFIMTRRTDLENDNIEALFIEVIHENNLKFILVIACIHPNKHDQLKEFTALTEIAKKMTI